MTKLPHCRNGHPFTPENTVFNATSKRRQCLACGGSHLSGLRLHHERMRAQTHCRNGHEFTPENTIIASDGWRRCRACHREASNRSNKKVPLSAERASLIVEAIHGGATFMSIVGGIDRNTPTPRALCNGYQLKRLLETPRLGKRLRARLKANSLANRVAANRSRKSIAAPAVFRRNGTAVFDAIRAATDGLALSIRADVQSDMLLAVAEGRLKPYEIAARVREFVTAHNRMFSPFVPVVGGFMRSLDKPVFDDGPMTLGDTVTRGLWD